MSLLDDNRLSSDLRQIIEEAREEFVALKGARIFMTGGTGFIGTWMAESFGAANEALGLGAEIVILTRDSAAFRSREPRLSAAKGIRFHNGDICSFASPKGSFSHVLHAATPASAKINVEEPLIMVDTIVDGTRRVLDFAVESGARVVLQTSSGAVYGKQPDDLSHLPETYEGSPNTTEPWSAYGEGKRMAELLGTIYSKKQGFEHRISRIFALVGPRLPLDIHYALGNFILDAIKGGPIKVGGDGTPLRSYLYISDLVIGLWKVLVRGGNYRIYNLGSEEAVSILEVAHLVGKAMGVSFDVQVANKAMPGQPGNRYVPSTSRIRSDLGFEPKVSLEEGIRRTVDWARPFVRKEEGLASV